MCGIIGVYNSKDASYLSYLGLTALQHRGQEGAGIVSFDGEKIQRIRGKGLVSEVFDNDEKIKSLEGIIAIGHNRYATIDSVGLESFQPLKFSFQGLKVATAHNGNLTNYLELRDDLESKGAIFDTDLDSEIFAHLIAHAKGDTIQERIKDSFNKIDGSYSLIIMTQDELIGVRDPWGNRPFAFGNKDDSFFLASETTAFDLVDAKEIRQVKPGEILTINKNEIKSDYLTRKEESKFCIFEHVYFSRPDSMLNGKNIDKYRRRLGIELAKQHPVDADIVIPVPDSGTTSAMGYSLESGIPFDFGLVKNHYIGRTFIKPTQEIRDLSVKKKLNPVSGVINGQRIIIVDDSIVRGTTMKQLTNILYEQGAKEVHIRISSDLVAHPCYHGMDFPSKNELFANKPLFANNPNKIEAMKSFFGVDSIGFLSLDGMINAVPEWGYCASCFDGNYHTKPQLTK